MPQQADTEDVVNLVSSTGRVSGMLIISQSSVVCYIHDLSKSIQSC